MPDDRVDPEDCLRSLAAEALLRGSGRVALPAPAQVPVGRSDPPWPTPAECYLAALAPVTRISMEAGGTVAEAGRRRRRRLSPRWPTA